MCFDFHLSHKKRETVEKDRALTLPPVIVKYLTSDALGLGGVPIGPTGNNGCRCPARIPTNIGAQQWCVQTKICITTV